MNMAEFRPAGGTDERQFRRPDEVCAAVAVGEYLVDMVFHGVVGLPAYSDTAGDLTRPIPPVTQQCLYAIRTFGVGWRLSHVLFGLGVVRLGLAVAFAIVSSLAAAVGSLFPWWSSITTRFESVQCWGNDCGGTHLAGCNALSLVGKA